MKQLEFSVAETIGRSFDLPLDKAIAIIKELQDKDVYLRDEEVDFEDEYEVANFFVRNGLLGELDCYEVSNGYNETVLASSGVYNIEE